MCSAYPAIWRGIHSSHSARVIGRMRQLCFGHPVI